ncbi:MAG TPA: NAD(P)-binding domain-containing protein [Nocardioidaceae bacterium]|nr:NAD(P)-binding domain-containing protein [Nocardioidaceae bacterium]
MSARVCIIGAGSSGIAAAQVLHSRGVDFDCFEMGSEVGGNWRYQNDNGMSSAYKSLHINTSRQLMEYRTFPMPEDLPDYPSHWQIAEYFDSYVDHFGFRDKISFRTEVVKVEPLTVRENGTEQDRYAVTLRARNQHGDPSEPEVRNYEHVIVANGHHWDPRWPEPSFPGAESFPGQQIHAHYYKTPDIFEGKRVLVLGIGNSACDIAVESSRTAQETCLAMRRGAHVVPKFVFGVPTDHLTDSVVARMPLRVQQLSMAAMLRLAQGKVTDYGLPKPDHAVLHAHPTVSDDLLSRLGHGDITVKPNIDRFEGPKVFFEDGSAVEVDVVVYCTGYKVTFPFFDERVVRAEGNHIDLYRRVVDPEHPGLYFVGLIQPLGAIMPLAEVQAEWVADLVSGEGELPSYVEMRTQIEEYDAHLRKRYVASKRHTIQVDFHKYFAEIERERRASRARALGRPVTRTAKVRQGVRGGVQSLAAAARSLRR